MEELDRKELNEEELEKTAGGSGTPSGFCMPLFDDLIHRVVHGDTPEAAALRSGKCPYDNQFNPHTSALQRNLVCCDCHIQWILV